MWAHMKKHRMSAQVTSQKTTNEEDAFVEQPGSEPSLREERGGFETRIRGMDNVTGGSSEINPHPQNVDNQGVTENSAPTNLEREEGVENRQNACIGEGANSGGEASNKEGTSNGEGASNKEGACRSSQDDQQAIVCEPEMEGERRSVSQSVEGGGHRPEAECHGKETLDGKEKEIQPTIITVKRGSKEVPFCMKYSADISILLSTVQSFCPYCQKSSINMIKHLQLRHATETDVQEAIKMPIEFEAGKKLWADLIMRGNKGHNDRVMQAGAGDLIPLRRIHRAATLKDYDFCFTCYLFIKKVNHMHKFFCKNSRQTFDDIEEETLRRSAVDSRHNCFCKAAAKTEAAAKSPDVNQRKNSGVAKFHIKSDSAINFDQFKNMEKMKISKSQCCLYCQKLVVRMSDHLTKAHSDQQEVQQALRHPKKSKERRRLFLVLLKKGNYKHNKRVSHLGSGFMIPVSLHRQRFGDHGRFVHCEVCLGLYSTRGFKKHMERHHNEGDTTKNTQGLFMNGEGNQKIKQLPPRSASKKDNASGENQDVSRESSEESDDEWDRAEFRRLQRAKYRRLQKRKQSQREDQSNDRAGQDSAAGDGATQQGAATMQHGPTKEKKRKVARKGAKLWSDEELAAIDSFFSKHIEELRVPGKEQCDAAKQKFPEALKKRDWKGIKFCVYNKIQTRKKRERREEEGGERSTDKCPWTQPEVCAVEKYMQSFINDLVTPGKLDCLQVKRRCGAVLRGRSWKQIKFYVYNRVLKQRRMQSNG